MSCGGTDGPEDTRLTDRRATGYQRSGRFSGPPPEPLVWRLRPA
jgi:hypothetical protein